MIVTKLDTAMARHNLYEIDLEKGTAFCTVCGYTEIYVAKSRTRTKPKIYCINRANQLHDEAAKRQRLAREKKQAQPDWKPRHSLSEIDAEKMTAVCAICGPTEILINNRKSDVAYYCANRLRDYWRKYRRTRYVSKSTNPRIHKLTEVDEEKKTAICSQCGHVKIIIWKTKKKINRRCINASKKRRND